MLTSPAFQEYVRSEDFLRQLNLPKGTVLTFSTLRQGEYNANYSFTHPVTGRKLVLRINTGSQMHLENQIEYEFSALRALQPAKRTPEALFFDDSRKILSSGALVMEWLPGRPLRYETDLAAAAEIFADIHTLPVPKQHMLIAPQYPAQDIFEECLAMAEQYLTWEAADPKICLLLEELIREIQRLPLTAAADVPRCIVNTEVNSGNFLINDFGRSYLVDWEKPLLSEAAQDLGHFLVPTTTFWKTDVILTPEEIAEFLRLYIRAVDGRMDTSLLSERVPLFFTVTCLRGVSWCAMALREYAQPGRALTNADTLKKLHQYISEDFLENLLEKYVRCNFLQGAI